MKSNFFIIVIFLICTGSLYAENLSIQAKNIEIKKDELKTIFKDKVLIVTDDGYKIESEYAEYNKSVGLITLRKSIKVTDKKENIIETEFAEYNEKNKELKSIGYTKISTVDGYILTGEDIFLNEITGLVKSINKATIIDDGKNKIFLDNFEFNNKNNIFKSIGLIKIEDKSKNNYEFSQIYIDTDKKEILGTDVKAFLESAEFKSNKNNNPRIFSNSIKIKENNTTFLKSTFTMCAFRKNDKCPPWEIRSGVMTHDKIKKTIYYDDTVVKIFDIPVFFFPKFAHPDPTVERRSGFLPPTLASSKNLGTSFTLPYFFAINNDRDFTISPRLFRDENPLFLGEYRQAFKNSNLILDFGYTEGYKNSSLKKTPGSKSHFFSKFVKIFKNKDNEENSIELSIQKVSNDKYLKLYKPETNLVDYDVNTLENSIKFSHQKDDLFFGASASSFETLKTDYNDKYEYIFPELVFDKNILNDELSGELNLHSNFKVHNYETNKTSKFLINDLDWVSNKFYFLNSFENTILGKIKNVNYDTKNISDYKNSSTNELFGAIGFLSELNLLKQSEIYKQTLKPKLFLRYSPGQMRKEDEGSRLSFINAFDIDRLGAVDNMETGLSATYGFDYEMKNFNRKFKFSMAQVVKDTNDNSMPSKTSLDKRFSDVVGGANYKINDQFSLNYNYALDQNFSEMNYNEIETVVNYNMIDFNISYLQEKDHIGNNEYIKSKINIFKDKNYIFSAETKKNLITNSSEYYNLSYEYMNDCLKAGLVYRREFYNDSELEPEKSLLFKITLIPFGGVDTPAFYN